MLRRSACYPPRMPDSELASSFLIAMPQLQDPNFRRSVVLLVQHGDDGTFGLVLNRPVELKVLSLCASLDVSWQGDPAENIHWGGPVQPTTGWALFDEALSLSSDDEDVTPLSDGLYFGGSLSVLRSVAETPPEHLRLFLGYAGWGPGQLERELTEGAWLLAPLKRDLMFGVPAESMWENVVRHLGVDPATLIATRGVH